MNELDTAIPGDVPPGGEERATSLVCPDCAGTLVVRREGSRSLVFRCRVGHLYATPELLAGKEARLEVRLWSVVAALDELAALLRDLGCDPERRQRVERHAAMVREIIEQSRAVRLDDLGSCVKIDEEEP